MFLFIDNSTIGSTYYQGYSTSWKLLGIIWRLYQAIRDEALILHVIHVVGAQMKAWRVDGLPGGDLLEGMMAGEDPLSFVPLAREQMKGPIEGLGSGLGASGTKTERGGSLGET